MERTPTTTHQRHPSLGAEERAAASWNLTGGVRRHGPAFAAFAEAVGHIQVIRDPRLFERTYVGRWDTMQAFVDGYIEESGLSEALRDLPGEVRKYATIDPIRVATDLCEQLLVLDVPDNGVWVFDAQPVVNSTVESSQQ